MLDDANRKQTIHADARELLEAGERQARATKVTSVVYSIALM